MLRLSLYVLAVHDDITDIWFCLYDDGIAQDKRKTGGDDSNWITLSNGKHVKVGSKTGDIIILKPQEYGRVMHALNEQYHAKLAKHKGERVLVYIGERRYMITVKDFGEYSIHSRSKGDSGRKNKESRE